MEPREPLNAQVSFKCKVCDFKSKNDNTIKIHLLEHIDQSSKKSLITMKVKAKTQKLKKLSHTIFFDKYSDDGKPLFDSDTDSKSDSS